MVCHLTGSFRIGSLSRSELPGMLMLADFPDDQPGDWFRKNPWGFLLCLVKQREQRLNILRIYCEYRGIYIASQLYQVIIATRENPNSF